MRQRGRRRSWYIECQDISRFGVKCAIILDNQWGGWKLQMKKSRRQIGTSQDGTGAALSREMSQSEGARITAMLQSAIRLSNWTYGDVERDLGRSVWTTTRLMRAGLALHIKDLLRTV